MGRSCFNVSSLQRFGNDRKRLGSRQQLGCQTPWRGPASSDAGDPLNPKAILVATLLIAPLPFLPSSSAWGACVITGTGGSPHGGVMGDPSGAVTLTAYWDQTEGGCSADAQCTFTLDNGPVSVSTCEHPGDCSPAVCHTQSTAQVVVTPGPHQVTATFCYADEAGQCIDTRGVNAWSFTYVPAPCQALEDGTVDVCLAPTTLVKEVGVSGLSPTGPQVHYAGYVDLYEFHLPTGGIVTLPCVTLVVESASPNPCETAGGVFVSRLETLVDRSPTTEQVDVRPPTITLGVCNAVLVATVDGIGVTSQPAYTLCDVNA